MTGSCYICGEPAQERDHFPVPKSLGGTRTLPICMHCHDQKDRFLLETWDPDEVRGALMGLVEKCTSTERLLLVKIVHIATQGTAVLRKMNMSGRSRRKS